MAGILYLHVILQITNLYGDARGCYSPSIHHRCQTSAFIAGELKIGESPKQLAHDLVWHDNSVHQVWGLGVACWRMPFEIVGSMLGVPGVPDTLTFGAAVALTAWLVIITIVITPWTRRHAPAYEKIVKYIGSTILLLFLPPFLCLLRTRFDIYEEVIAYEYLYGLILICAIMRVASNPTCGRLVILGLAAGIGGFIRPTLVFYGTGAVCVGLLSWLLQCGKKSEKVSGIGHYTANNIYHLGNQPQRQTIHLKSVIWLFGIYFVGGGMLFITNLIRFGNGFEFGHRLNLQNLYGSMYATRFDHPYQNENLISATRELLGLLFFTSQMNGSDHYESHFFPGQSATTRWREIYMSSYDWTYLPLIIGGVVAGVMAVCRLRRNSYAGRQANVAEAIHDREIAALVFWGVLSSMMLFVFYLRNSVISSRYLLDFMPAFAALMVAGWQSWCRWFQIRQERKVMLLLIYSGLCIWLWWQCSKQLYEYGSPRLLTWAEVQNRMEQHKAKAAQPCAPLPNAYTTNTKFAEYKIPYNGAGWTPETGAVKPLIILFMEDVEYLELTVTSARAGGEDAVPRHVRAKIGLEHLEQESLTKTEQGWVVRFRGPKARRYQKGLQVAFVVFVPNTRLADVVTPWRLLKAQWKGTSRVAQQDVTFPAAAADARSIR